MVRETHNADKVFIGNMAIGKRLSNPRFVVIFKVLVAIKLSCILVDVLVDIVDDLGGNAAYRAC